MTASIPKQKWYKEFWYVLSGSYYEERVGDGELLTEDEMGKGKGGGGKRC